jgi:hypothetical protein
MLSYSCPAAPPTRAARFLRALPLEAHLPTGEPEDPHRPPPPPPVPGSEPPPVPEGDPPTEAPPERLKPAWWH